MKRIIKPALVAIAAFAFSGLANAASDGSGVYRPSVRINPTDIPTLQRGYAVFIQTCLSCHSLELMRYNRVAEDLEWSEEDMREVGLIPGDAKMVDYIKTQLDSEGAMAAYGVVPPDLSLKARERGVDWVHGFLTGYYQDSDSKIGFNNAVLVNTAMPNVLAGKQGMQKPVYEEHQGKKQLVGLALTSAGALNAKQFYEEMRDLVSFLRYASEPAIIKRTSLGACVIGFLLILLLLTWLLKREYWRDIKKGGVSD